MDDKFISFKDPTEYSFMNNVKQIKNDMDCYFCDVASTTAAKRENSEREHALKDKVIDFFNMQATQIISNADGNLTKDQVAAIVDKIAPLDPFVSGELLLTIEETGNIDDLTNDRFIEDLGKPDPYVASALLYEIRLTRNIMMLTDPRLFTSNSTWFLNTMGVEAASEFINTVGITGAIDTLLKCMNNNVLSLVAGNGKLASEYFYAAAQDGFYNIVSDPQFIDSVKMMGKRNANSASEYLSALWCTGNKQLASTETLNKVINGNISIWGELARQNNLANQKVIIAKPGDDTHDRGVKLMVQSLLKQGYDVLFLNNVKNAKEILDLAKSESVKVIGFSMLDDSHKNFAVDTLRMAQSLGRNIAMFGGGILSKESAADAINKGIKLFMEGNAIKDVMRFIREHANLKTEKPLDYKTISTINKKHLVLSPEQTIKPVTHSFSTSFANTIISMKTEIMRMTSVNASNKGMVLVSYVLAINRKKVLTNDTAMIRKIGVNLSVNKKATTKVILNRIDALFITMMNLEKGVRNTKQNKIRSIQKETQNRILIAIKSIGAGLFAESKNLPHEVIRKGYLKNGSNTRAILLTAAIFCGVAYLVLK